MLKASVSRLLEIVSEGMTALEPIPAFDPSTLAFRLVVIRRIADADLNIGIQLYLVCFVPLFGE